MKDTKILFFCVSLLVGSYVFADPQPAAAGQDGSDSGSSSYSYALPTLSGGLAAASGTKTDAGWFLLDGYYTPYKHMKGGGGSAAGEYIDPDVRIGLGARVGLTFLSGHEGNFKIKNDTLDLDLHVPVKLADWLIVYGGVGVQLFDMEYSYTIPGTYRYQDGHGGYYTKNGKKVTYVCDKPSDITTVYAGLRLMLTDSFYVYGEYHKDSGKISMMQDYGSGPDLGDIDMDASRYIVGAGFAF